MRLQNISERNGFLEAATNSEDCVSLRDILQKVEIHCISEAQILSGEQFGGVIN